MSDEKWLWLDICNLLQKILGYQVSALKDWELSPAMSILEAVQWAFSLFLRLRMSSLLALGMAS